MEEKKIPRELWDLPLSEDPELNRIADLLIYGLMGETNG
jgi:hypothetical protein